MATITTSDEHIIVERDYTDNFSVKETAMQKLAPKYFGDEALAQLNVGALGFTMEQIANITEDSFNTMAMLIHEAFPNKAIIPENIYSHAAIFQIDNTFTTCAKCTFIMLLNQSEILQYGETVDNKVNFFIDKDTRFTVIGGNKEIPFTLDYDIHIQALRKQVTGSDYDYSFSAKYILDSKNGISEINDPYLKIRKLPNGMILLQFTAHQVERTVIEDVIMTNTKVNYPVKTYTFQNGLAGFDIFYRAPGQKDWTQLTPRIKFSLPVKQPFCFYRLKSDDTLEITFSSRDGYFKPEFNSELKLILYTTIGTAGEFPNYDGSQIDILPCEEHWEYNKDITIAVKTVSDSAGASEKLSLEALQALTVERYASASEIATENDLYNYFMNFKYRYGNEICIVKRRDDVTERLFSAFMLMKHDDYIYPTNTMDIVLKYEDYDIMDETGKFVLSPGHIFVYADDDGEYLTMIPNVFAYETEKVNELMSQYPFVYTNPFLICMNRTPNLVGIYQTTVDQTCSLDYVSANDDSFIQFVTSKIRVHRGLEETPVYDIQIGLLPSGTNDAYITNLNTNEGNATRVVVGICNNSGEEVCYLELFPTEIDPNDAAHVTFTGKLEINDVVSSTGYVKAMNVVKKDKEGSDTPNIPIKDVTFNVYILHTDGVSTANVVSNYFENMDGFMLTNTYSNKSDPLTLIEPLNMMRSTVTFTNHGTKDDPIISTTLSLIPVIKADIIQDMDNYDYFINRMSANYQYIYDCMGMVRNNTNIDIKLYNTYGRSHNYTIGDDGEMIDRVNLTIQFRVTLVDGADEIAARKNITAFIKQFIEKVNAENGANNLYISNLIREIENNISAVNYLKFLGINEYDTTYQTISVKEPNLNNLSKEDRRKYVPECLVVNPEDIRLAIIVN